jgi:UDP-glucose 4-epimerase
MIAVTGASGFLGQWVVERLTARGSDVICISRRPTQSPKIAGTTWKRPVHTLACDISDPESVKACSKELSGVKTLIHLAAYIPKNTALNTHEDALSTLQLNVLGTARLLDAVRNVRDLSYIIYASTFEVYGVPQRTPIDEEHPTLPVNYYAASKLTGEKLVAIASAARKIATCTLRFPAIYGPGDTQDRAIGNFARAAASGEDLVVYGDGSDRRELVYVGDAADAVALATQKHVSCVLNIASGKGFTVKEMADVVLQGTSTRARIVVRERVRPKLDYVMAIDRAREVLGWAPSTPLEEGVKTQLAWLGRTS